MNDLNNNNTKFNLPTYLNIPLFLYQDSRLEKSALLIAAFFYSIHTAGQSITASTDYLCALANIHKRQLYNIFNDLEEYGYIKRTGFTNRKTTKWVYSPKSNITVTESDTSAPQCTPVQELNTSAIQCTQLVQSSALNLCTPLHTDNKEDNKEDKTTTTVPTTPPTNPNPSSSSSFFSEKQKEELLTYKMKIDERSDKLFLENCTHHVENQTNDLSKYQRYSGLKNILTKCYEMNEPFQAKGFNKISLVKKDENKTFTEEDFNNWKRGEKGFDWVGPLYNKQRAQG